MTRPAKTLFLSTVAARALLAGERVEIRAPADDDSPPWTVGQVLPAREPWAMAEPGPLNRDALIAYRADYAQPVGVPHWCSASSLPAWAVRLHARVVEVRVETVGEPYPRREWVALIHREAPR